MYKNKAYQAMTEVKFGDCSYYVDHKVSDLISRDFIDLFARNHGNLKDSKNLTCTIKKIVDQRERNRFIKKISPFLLDWCKINQIALDDIAVKIYKNCIQQPEFSHSDGCMQGGLCVELRDNGQTVIDPFSEPEAEENAFALRSSNPSSAAISIEERLPGLEALDEGTPIFEETKKSYYSSPNMNTAIVFDVNGKSFPIKFRDNQPGFVAFTDHHQTKLFIRQSIDFAGGTEKKVFNFINIPFKSETNTIDCTAKTILSCKSLLLEKEIGFLSEISCPYVINNPPTFIAVAKMPEGSDLINTFEYLVTKADGTLNVEYVKEKKLSDAQILKYALHIAKGLQYLHEDKKILHSDIKGDNILIFDDIAKIADLGSCCAESRSSQHLDLTIRSPELRHGPQETSLKSYPHDMFSLGYTLYTYFSRGEKPYFDNSTPFAEGEESHQNKLFSDWPKGGDEVEEMIRQLISKLLILNPKERLKAKEAVEFIEKMPAELGFGQNL
ncbi:MAG: protein kinase [Parachlamydiaceae bacterium]|nr:protein kinase [Parachlamydiaceae bacterium]